jgi:hypothetical protein
VTIAEKIQQEIVRATCDGIGRETLSTAREGQLAGYLAGLEAAKRLAR